MEGFKESLDNSTDGTAIDIVIKKEWIKNPSAIVPTVEGASILSVERIEFTDKGKEVILDNNLWMLSGNHWRATLLQYVVTKEKQLEDMKKVAAKMEASEKPEEEDGTDEGNQELDRFNKVCKRMEEEIEASSMWAVRLYNRGV